MALLERVIYFLLSNLNTLCKKKIFHDPKQLTDRVALNDLSWIMERNAIGEPKVNIYLFYQMQGITLLFAAWFAVNKVFLVKLTTSKWAKISKCSTDTVLRDIQGLERKEMLEKEPGGGRSTSYKILLPKNK